jgi:enterochelin esterase-like enzyme
LIQPARTELPGVDFAHDSRTLGRTKAACVLVPQGRPPDSGWPTCYLLHSYGGNRFSWLFNGGEAAMFGEIDAVFVFPESGRRWFINDISGRRYADYFIADLLPAVEAQFPCRKSRESRIVGGFSMGGAAAVYLSLIHPELIGAAFSYGGAFYASDRVGDPYADVRHTNCMMPTEADHNRVWGPPGSPVRKRYDPDRLLAQAARQPQQPSIAIEVGLHDYPRVLAQNRRMHAALTSAGMRHGYAERPGDHSWPFAVAAATRILSSSAIGLRRAPARSGAAP